MLLMTWQQLNDHSIQALVILTDHHVSLDLIHGLVCMPPECVVVNIPSQLDLNNNNKQTNKTQQITNLYYQLMNENVCRI